MNVELYLKENIDEDIVIENWNKKNDLPLFLRNNYDFYEMMILGSKCVLIEVIDDMPNLDQLQKHIKQIRNITDHEIVLFYKEISRYRRKSLMQNRMAFVIEDGQMYLPFLGLDLKKVKEQVDKKFKHFTTPAQIAYLYFLYHKDEVVNMTEFAQKFGFNKMTASRALNDLYHANLIIYEVGGKTGRSKDYKRIQDPDYFLNGRLHLKTPVKETIYVKTKPLSALTAGLDALACISMINPPGHLVMAIDRKQLKSETIEIVKNKDFIKDTQLVELQLWDYDPKLFSDNNYVDLLSLYVSLEDDSDERIEQALEKVLLGELWYTD